MEFAVRPARLGLLALLAACSGGGGDGDGGRPGPDSSVPVIPTACGTPTIRVTEVDLGESIDVSEDEVRLRPLALSPIPGGGSRLAYMGTDGDVHVAELDAADALVGTPVSFQVNDFQDLLADDDGGYLLVTRDAQGGGTLNCGSPTNLCGTPPTPPVACHDMMMLRFDGANEAWATTLTSATDTLPPYSTGPTGPQVTMIWWYAHHGRLATDGTNVAAYYGAALSVSQGGCINIHQGDRMDVISPTGTRVSSSDDFEWGCSHSGYEHVIHDPRSDRFVAICKTDNQNRLAFAPTMTTIAPVDLAYANPSDPVPATGGGYWMLTSDARPGQPALADGLAEVRLLHFTSGAADSTRILASESGVNARAPQLAAYGDDHLVALWETSASPGDLGNESDRAMHLQILRQSDGAAAGEPLSVAVRGNRYQAVRSFPDGSVAFPARGTSGTKARIVRVMPCGG